MAFHNLNHPFRLQNSQMPTQISVGQRAKLLQIIEDQTLGIRDQRCQNAKTRPFMNHSIKAFIGKATFAR